MPTLEALRNRIATANDLYGVVRVMKALAAVGIRQYERAVESLAEYDRTVTLGLQVVLRHQPEELTGLMPPPGRRLGVIVYGSDQGMCGSFNEQLATFARERTATLAPEPRDRTVIALGARLADHLEGAGQPVEGPFAVPGSLPGITPVVNDLVVRVEELQARRGIGRVIVVHNRPLSGAAYQPHATQLLPLDPSWLAGLRAKAWPGRSLPAFTVPWVRLFSALVREHLFVSLYRPLAESLAAENASRLAAMQAAETNIEDHLARLTSRYHQTRQQSITEELTDIVSGFEALAPRRRPERRE